MIGKAIRQYSYLFISLLISIKAYSQYEISVPVLQKAYDINLPLGQAFEGIDSITSFTQLEPNIGKLSSQKTVLKSAQDSNTIYFYFTCYTGQPDDITAGFRQRDQLDTSDDIISIILDTYSDNRTAFLFQVNAIGTISDAKISDDGKTVDYLWDTEWRARTVIDSNSWRVEVHIPFKGIQYKPGNSSWGCNFSRSIRKNQEIAWWAPVSESNRVSQNGTLLNVQSGLEKLHDFEFYPYGTLRYEDSDISEVHREFNRDIGIDIQYKYSSNFKTNVSVNPDFATVEGDKEQINLTPWELKFPEKRLFFQDGNEMFGTRIQTFYSRRIGDMKYGGKVMGKGGKFQFNGLLTQTKEDLDENIPSARFSAFRLKRDILKSSTIGFIYTDKITDSLKVHTYNMDYVVNLGNTWKLTGQFVASTPGDLKTHSAWFVRFARENNSYHYHLRFTSLGKDFKDNVNETGFIQDDDRLELDSDINYKFWLKMPYKYLYLSGKNNIYWSQEGLLRSWYLTYKSRIYLGNRFSFDASYNNEYKYLEGEHFYNHFYQAVAGYNTDESSNIEVHYRFGDNFNRSFHLLRLNTQFNLFEKLSVDYEFDQIKYSPDTLNQNTIVNILGLSYYFTKDLWIRVFAQGNTKLEKVYFYGKFGWRFKPPFGALYLIINSDDYVDFDEGSTIQSKIVFLKLTYPISTAF